MDRKNIVIPRVRYDVWFQACAVGLGTYHPRRRGLLFIIGSQARNVPKVHTMHHRRLLRSTATVKRGPGKIL